MQTALRKSSEKTKSKDKIEVPTSSRKSQDDNVRDSNNISTPKNFMLKSSTADIYSLKKKSAAQATKAPRKPTSTTRISGSVPPMKDILKSSQSSVSVISSKSGYDKKTPSSSRSVQNKAPKIVTERKAQATTETAKSTRTAKDLPFVNVTVNSPAAKRKLNLTKSEEVLKKLDSKKVSRKENEVENKKERPKEVNIKKDESKEVDQHRHRTKTRTLDESEVKVLTPELVDNNTEMKNLTKMLNAKPKAFYVDLEVDEKQAEDDVSYEDDFESYESDFESYHSQSGEEEGKTSEGDDVSEGGGGNDEQREGKDEESMLDSGSFDLREQRSATKKPSVMAFISEDSETEEKPSLLDEGFQEMSAASTVSSMRHVDVLDRPLFVDFSKSKENRRKRRICEQFKQRASDLLSMITLHEMSYNLFEMKPIPYDLYMATFGRSNYTQSSVQTFDDGVTEEVQTEEIEYAHKWTQHPVEFSKSDIYLNKEVKEKKYCGKDEDYTAKFMILINKDSDEQLNNQIETDKCYAENPLRMFLEQKDGVGASEMLPYENYKSKLKNNNFNVHKMNKFLKKVESRVSNILSANIGNKNIGELTKNSKYPFSKGFLTISTKDIESEKFLFLKDTTILKVVFSETKTNLIMTIHSKIINNLLADKIVICLWDISVARHEPLKILIAIDNVAVARFKGSSDGIFVAAMEDGSIHLWDLSEEPSWRNDVASDVKSTNLVEINTDRMTQTEIDREWNLKNSNVGFEQPTFECFLQACAFTSSAANMSGGDVIDAVVGLEFVGDAHAAVNQDGGRKIVGQICSLQRIGILTIWSMVQEKTNDIGKAYWSKVKLEKTQDISLVNHIDMPLESENNTNFNLNTAKRRNIKRKSEKIVVRKDISRPKSAISDDFNISRPTSAASIKRVLSVEKSYPQNWENGAVCCDLKIMRLKRCDNYLIAKNCGEVLCCTRQAGGVKIQRFCVATDTSTVTCVEVSRHGFPYFLAATDSGTVNLCSMLDMRVLLTLDCRNVPPVEVPERCTSDHKGRYINTVSPSTRPTFVDIGAKLCVTSLHWCHFNPCCVIALLRDGATVVWELTHSDICAKHVSHSARGSAYVDNTLALLGQDGVLEIHRLSSEPRNNLHLELFNKYVPLL